MGVWSTHVVPRMAEASLKSHEIGELRREVCAPLTGRVLEIGFGSGLNLPHYGEAVDQGENIVRPNNTELTSTKPPSQLLLSICSTSLNIFPSVSEEEGPITSILTFPSSAGLIASITWDRRISGRWEKASSPSHTTRTSLGPGSEQGLW